MEKLSFSQRNKRYLDFISQIMSTQMWAIGIRGTILQHSERLYVLYYMFSDVKVPYYSIQ
jgi:hypothetical protein